MIEKQMNAANIVALLIARSREAQKIAAMYTQERVNELVKAIAWAAVKEENAKKIARLAVEESDLGYYEAKFIKLQKKVRGALRDIKDEKSVGVIERDEARGLVKMAKPAGVIGAIVPCTNPEATPVLKAMFALKGRNSIVFSPHPRTKRTNTLISDLMRDALKKYGAPEDLIISIDEPTIEISKELMTQSDLIIATGGTPMVKAAYSSGTPAYGVGTGNAVIIVDETADLNEAANMIMLSKTFDYGTSCSSDNSIVIQTSVYEKMLKKLQQTGGLLLSGEEKEKLKVTMWKDGHLNPDIIAQSPKIISRLSGIDVGRETKFFMVEEEEIGKDHPFSGEKLSVVLTIYRYDDFDEAIDIVDRITTYQGKGHSGGIYSNNEEHIMRFGLKSRLSRIMVRQPQCYGNSGSWNNGMPFTMTLGCGTWGGNISSENITWKHMINTTWLSFPIRPEIPSDDELFGEMMVK